MNTARGFLAEFLVARAVGSTDPIRVEWASYDVEAPDGTRIEVKATGYAQSWSHARDSTPSYDFKSAYATTTWDDERGEYVRVRPEERVHVWVFALHTARLGDPYDPLDIARWEFRVVPHGALIRTGQKSAGLSLFDRLGIEPVGWHDLPEAIAAARAEHDRIAAARSEAPGRS
jgi:hypothetical protein